LLSTLIYQQKKVHEIWIMCQPSMAYFNYFILVTKNFSAFCIHASCLILYFALCDSKVETLTILLLITVENKALMDKQRRKMIFIQLFVTIFEITL